MTIRPDPNLKRVHMNFLADDWDWLVEMAANQGLTASAIVRGVIHKYVKSRKEALNVDPSPPTIVDHREHQTIGRSVGELVGGFDEPGPPEVGV